MAEQRDRPCRDEGLVCAEERSLSTELLRHVHRLVLAGWVRTPTAASENSSSLNLGLADWPLLGIRYFRFGSLCKALHSDPLLPLGSSKWWPQRSRSIARLEQHQTSFQIEDGGLRGPQPAIRSVSFVRSRLPPCQRPAGPGPTRARTEARTRGPSWPPPPRSSRSKAP